MFYLIFVNKIWRHCHSCSWMLTVVVGSNSVCECVCGWGGGGCCFAVNEPSSTQCISYFVCANYEYSVQTVRICRFTQAFAVPWADPEEGVPPGKSQVIWVSIGNKLLDLSWKMLDPHPWKMLDPPPGKCWTPPPPGKWETYNFLWNKPLDPVCK